jgi:hypothetical protein
MFILRQMYRCERYILSQTVTSMAAEVLTPDIERNKLRKLLLSDTPFQGYGERGGHTEAPLIRRRFR